VGLDGTGSRTSSSGSVPPGQGQRQLGRLRALSRGRHPNLPIDEGYEIQIYSSEPAKNSTGAIYNFQPPSEVPQKAPGEWNEMEITAQGQKYTVRLNGKVINTYTGSRSVEGMIGLQNHTDEVSFRNVRVKELR
jgi:hypothetical protein